MIVETLLGPALILALALQGTWCLHASAATLSGAVIAVVGQSGNGKSTLAAFLGSAGGSRWRRMADDVLPVELAADGLEALPHFPQLKLAPEEQPSIGMPERMPVRAVYLLEEPDPEQDGVGIQPLSTQEAVLALVRHSVAARLFDRGLLAQHLSFCVEATTRVPVRRLSYPRRRDVLPRVRDRIAADLEAHGGG